MRIYQLIYTKTEESPWKKAGFHAAFYPLELLGADALYAIESHIHWPQLELGALTGKQSVFFVNLAGEDNMLVLTYRDLPEAVDRFGRGGIFMCQALIYPPALWKRFASPLDAYELAKDLIFKSREEALASPLIDKTTGNFRPVEIPEDKLPGVLAAPLPRFESELERRLVLLLCRFAAAEKISRFGILIRGNHASVTRLLNKAAAYLPDAWKAKIGWDSALDQGQLARFPLKIAGYSAAAPAGGACYHIDIESGRLEEREAPPGLLPPLSPYEVWLKGFPGEAREKASLESAFAFSQYLEAKGPRPGVELLAAPPGSFAECHRDKIHSVFQKECASRLDPALAGPIAAALTAQKILEFVVRDFPAAELANPVEQAVARGNLGARALSRPIPQDILAAGSPRLRRIASIWSAGGLPADEFASLDPEARHELLAYCLRSGSGHEDWLAGIFRHDAELLGRILQSRDLAQSAWRIIQNAVRKARLYAGLEEALFQEAYSRGMAHALLCGALNLPAIFEDWFRRGRAWTPAEIQALRYYIGANPCPDPAQFPFVCAYLYPAIAARMNPGGAAQSPSINPKENHGQDAQATRSIGQDVQATREAKAQGAAKAAALPLLSSLDEFSRLTLMNWLLDFHQYPPDVLLQLGFPENEIHAAVERRAPPKTFMDKMKSIFTGRGGHNNERR